MAVRLPPSNLNPAAQPWARRVELLLEELSNGQAGIRTNHATVTRAVGAVSRAVPSLAAQFATVTSRTASAPSGLTGVATGYFDSVTGNAEASVVLAWTAPSVYTDGTAMTPLLYEIHRMLPGSVWTFVTNVTDPSATLLRQPFNGGSVQYRVRAQGDNGGYSAWSTAATVTMPTALTGPGAPSTPALASDLGMVTATWDGKIAGVTPGASIRGVYAEISTNAGATWTMAGQLMQASGGRASAMGPFTDGTVVVVRLRAIDALGQIGTASATATITVRAASAIDTVIANLSTTTTTALNGKNKTSYSTSDPGAGYTGVAGDLWYKTSTGSSPGVIGFWRWSGTGWIAQTMTGTTLSALDATTITTGFLGSARIAANTITASQVAIADFTNWASGSDFEDPALIPWTATPTWGRDSNNAHTGTYAWRANGTVAGTAPMISPLNVGTIQAAAAETWYVELWALGDAAWNGVGANNSNLRIGNQAGALIGTIALGATDLTLGTWARKTLSFIVPAGTTSLQFDLRSDATAGNLWVDDILIRRKLAGVLVVDGTIDTNQLAANAVKAGKIDAGVITGTEINATVGLSGIIVTGGTVQTSGTASRGVKLTGNGLTAYNGSGVATFTVDGTTGAVVANTLTATGATISGAITATSGSITGTLTVTGTLQTGATGARVAVTSAGITGYDSTGAATFTYLTADGIIKATGGIFTNVQVTGTSTFAGTLSGATGSFSGAITASSGSITGTLEVTGTIRTATSGARVQVSGAGIAGFNSAGTVNFSYLSADGVVKATGGIFTDLQVLGNSTFGGTMTVNGTMQTSASAARVVMDSSGFRGYNSAGTQTFSVLEADGIMKATGADVAGKITASSGSITGQLVVSGGLYTSTTAYPRSRFDAGGLLYDASSTFAVKVGSTPGNPGISWDVSGTNFGYLGVSSGGAAILYGASTLGLRAFGGNAGIDLTSDATGAMVTSATIRDRQYGTSSTVAMSTPSGSVVAPLVVTELGTIGISTGATWTSGQATTFPRWQSDAGGVSWLQASGTYTQLYSSDATHLGMRMISAGTTQFRAIGGTDGTGNIQAASGLTLGGANATGGWLDLGSNFARLHAAGSGELGPGFRITSTPVAGIYDGATGVLYYNGAAGNGNIYGPPIYSSLPGTPRAVQVASSGMLGTTSSSERTKNIAGTVHWGDDEMEQWLGLEVHRFAYKVDPKQKQTLGVIAERVHEAGFGDLVYYDDREDSEHHGRVDGFAYERMAVYEHMALQRLYARLVDLEREVAALRGA